MDKIFKLTASEYASMLGLTTFAIRKRRLKGLEENNFKFENVKYFYKAPERDRPNIVEVTPHNNPKFHGSQFRPLKYKSQYNRKKRRRNVAEGETNYHNARNGWQLEQLNNMRKLAKLNNELSADGLLEIKDDIIAVAKDRVQQRKKREAQSRAEIHFQRTDEGQKLNYLAHDRRLRDRESEQMSGRWFNHDSGQMEDFSPPKKKYDYYG